MITDLLPWATGAVTIVAMELVRRRRWEGWAVGLVAQGLWAWLIVAQRLWGLAPLCLILVVQYSLALRGWRREVRMRLSVKYIIAQQRLSRKTELWYDG